MNKILLINDYNFGGGAEGVFRDTYDILLKNNSVDVQCFYGSEQPKGPENVFEYFYNKKNVQALNKVLSMFKPDIIHIHNYYHYLSPGIFLSLRKYKKTNKSARVVFTAHDYHLICPSTGMMVYKNKEVDKLPIQFSLFSVFFKKIDYRGIKFSLIKKIYWFWAMFIVKAQKDIDLIISPSHFLKNVLDYHLKIKTVVVRNPLTINSSFNIKDKTPVQKQIRITYIGRLSNEKGLDVFLKAYAKLLETNKNVFLDILGDGIERDNLEALSKSLKITPFLCFHGHQNKTDLNNFLITNNVLILPSIWYENAPLSIIEAAATGNIILASNYGGMVELAELTNNYYLIDNWEEQLTQVISEIIIKNNPVNTVKNIDAFGREKYGNAILNQYKQALD